MARRCIKALIKLNVAPGPGAEGGSLPMKDKHSGAYSARHAVRTIRDGVTSSPFRDFVTLERMRVVSRMRDAADPERCGRRNFAFGAERIDGAVGRAGERRRFIGDERLVPALIASLVDGSARHVKKINLGRRQSDVVLADRVYAVLRLADCVDHRGKRHLPGDCEHHHLKQQREATKLAGPTGVDERDAAIGQPHAACALRDSSHAGRSSGVNSASRQCHPRYARQPLPDTEASAGSEVDLNREPFGGGVEINVAQKPPIAHTQCGSEQLFNRGNF